MSLGEIFPLPPKYIFQSELPRGFLGSSALVTQADTGQPYICKSIPLELIGSPDKCQRFKERLDHIQAVQSKYVLSYNDLIETNDRLLLIRPYIPDAPITESLCQSNDKNFLSTPSSAYSIWLIICQCFSLLHAHHIFPNFIKPNNVFITKDKKIIITDLYPPPSDIDIMLYSPKPFDVGFLAPEFFNQKPTNRGSDFWSLGVLLAFMVTKSLPWSSKNLFTMLQQINKCSLNFTTPIPENIEATIRSLIVLDPNQRKLPNLSGRTPSAVNISQINSNSGENQPLFKNFSGSNIPKSNYMMLQETSSGNLDSISRATTTKLLQNGLMQTGNILLRSRTISKNLCSSSQRQSLNPSQNTIKQPVLKGSAIKLPSFKNFD